MINHAVRCATVTNLLERAGFATKEVVQSQLKPYRIKRDNEDLNKVSSHNEKSRYSTAKICLILSNLHLLRNKYLCFK